MDILFAATTFNIDPNTLTSANIFGLFSMGAILVLGIGYMAWMYAPTFIARSRSKRAEKLRAANSIWFDARASVLHCGHNKKRIEPNSFEYFVCKNTFEAPDKEHSDLNIFEDAERAKGTRETSRGVEQAVRRLNQKARKLGLQNDLFKRSKERNSVSDEYRQHIVH